MTQGSHEVFFTSDTHFGHRFIFEQRGFDSLHDHDEELIWRWNSKVPKRAEVYHLGDFSFSKPSRTIEVIGRLNGKIHLIKGNHDNPNSLVRSCFSSYQAYKELSSKRFGRKICLFHYAQVVWNQHNYRS